MTVEARPLWGTFGAEVTGFELGRPQPAEAWRAVVAAGHRHGVIVLHGQATDEAGLVRFASTFGRPAIHVLAHFHVPGHPAILKLSNIVTGGEPWGLYDGANYWHTDMSYEDPPGAATIVHALKTPASGGGTRVADMHTAYDDLPDATKRRIEGLVVVHHYGNRDDLDEGSSTSAGKLEGDQRSKVRTVHHKLARPHPATGRKALYAVAGSSMGIVGMPDDEALALLRELAAHATAERYTATLRYAPGDIAVWDNSSTLHAAEPMAPVDSADHANARLLWRVSVKGAPALS